MVRSFITYELIDPHSAGGMRGLVGSTEGYSRAEEANAVALEHATVLLQQDRNLPKPSAQE